jgi:hypothetical protein
VAQAIPGVLWVASIAPLGPRRAGQDAVARIDLAIRCTVASVTVSRALLDLAVPPGGPAADYRCRSPDAKRSPAELGREPVPLHLAHQRRVHEQVPERLDRGHMSWTP